MACANVCVTLASQHLSRVSDICIMFMISLPEDDHNNDDKEQKLRPNDPFSRLSFYPRSHGLN